MLLNSTDTLKCVLAGAVTTNQLTFWASWSEWVSAAATKMAGDGGTTNSATPVTLVAAPSAGQRKVTSLHLYNADTAIATVTFSIDDGATRTLYKAVLSPGWTAHYADGRWFVTDASGVPLQSLNGGPIDYQAFTSVGAGVWTKPTTWTPRTTLVICVGAGGSGGSGGSHTGSFVRAGGAGGGGGCWMERQIPTMNLAATENVFVGTGGSAPAGRSALAGTDGNAGTASYFGSDYKVVGGGGGGGRGGAITAAAGGGGGGVAGTSGPSPTAGTQGAAGNAFHAGNGGGGGGSTVTTNTNGANGGAGGAPGGGGGGGGQGEGSGTGGSGGAGANGAVYVYSW